MEAREKIENLFIIAMRYYGKEVGLQSSQHFGIDQIRDSELESEGKYKFMMQYGFPQSGAVCIHFTYAPEESEVALDKVSVYALPEGEQAFVANMAPTYQEGPVSVSLNFGMDLGTIEHTTSAEIDANPNALKMLDVATSDLLKGQILGECMVAVPEGSDTIPCCTSRKIEKDKGRGR